MEKKILLIALLSGMSLSVYPARVLIENRTGEPVWARINDQVRDQVFVDKEMLALMGEILVSAVTLGTYKLLRGGFRVYEKAKGELIPNFIKISPKSSKFFSTALMRAGRAAGMMGGVTPIRKVTFIRVKGYEKITAPLRQLINQISSLGKKYGNIGFVKSPMQSISYVDGFSGNSKETTGNYGTKMTIEIPKLEKFTYEPDLPIRGGLKGVIELKSWGNVVRTDKSYLRKKKRKK